MATDPSVSLNMDRVGVAAADEDTDPSTNMDCVGVGVADMYMDPSTPVYMDRVGEYGSGPVYSTL
jgi:hypothetical protein